MSPPGAGVGAGGQARTPSADPARSRAFRLGRWPPGYFYFYFFSSRLLSIIGSNASSRVRGFSGPFRKGKAPGPTTTKARKGGGGGKRERSTRGKWGGGREERKQEEPQSCRPPAGRGPGCRDPSPSPNAPQGPVGMREKTEYKSLTTASSPAPAPPSHFPPATAAAAALGMIH